jgi:P27 family predicted phage terminase small subunit
MARRAAPGEGQAKRPNRIRQQPARLRKVPAPPRELPRAARRFWRRLVPGLVDRGQLTVLDMDQFAIYCDALAKLWQAAEALGFGPLLPGRRDDVRTNPAWKVYRELQATCRALGADFGLTPGARNRLADASGPPGELGIADRP